MSTDLQQRPLPDNDSGDRRALSVVFFDLSASSAHLLEAGAEAHMNRMQSFMQIVSEQVARNGGAVMQYLGDGAMCFFGYPRAHEDDAARALTASEAVIRIWAKTAPDAAMPARAGVSSGFALFGAPLGDSGVNASGEVINRAARLRDLAEPGEVLLCEKSRHLAREGFRFADRGHHKLRGFLGEEPIFALKPGTRPGKGRVAAADPHRMIGRAAEIAALQAEVARIGNGGRIVHVSGPPGIGKSRLVDEFLRHEARAERPTIRLDCRDEYRSTPFRPVRIYLETLIGARPEESEAAIRARIDVLLEQTWRRDLADREAILEALQFPRTTPPEPGSTPLSRRTQAIDCLAAELCMLAKNRNGLILVIEDMHWTDPSLDLLIAAIGQTVDTHPILMLMTSRRESLPDELQARRHAHLRLDPLDRDDCRELTLRIAGADSLPAAIHDQLYALTAGVPLFVKEFAPSASTPRLSLALGRSAVPLTLAANLQARFDDLDPKSRLFLRAGALIGQEFPVEAAAHAAALTGQVLAETLGKLDADTIIAIDPDRGIAQFSHALIRETVRQITAPPTARDLHARLAEFHLSLDHDPLSVAVHLAGAGRNDTACEYYCLSAQRKLMSGAIAEAERELETARLLLEPLPEDDKRDALERRILMLLGPVHMITGGPGSLAFGAVQNRAVAILSDSQSKTELLATVYNAALHYWAIGRFDLSQQMVERIPEDMPDEHGDIATMAQQTIRGLLAWHQGHNQSAANAFARVLTCYDPQRHAGLNFAFLKDFGVFGNFYSALASATLGDHVAANRFAEAAEALALDQPQMHDRGFSMLARFCTHFLAGRHEAAHEAAARTIEFSQRHGFPEFVAMGTFICGWSEAQRGAQAGIGMMEQGLTDWAGTNFVAWQTLFGAHLARAHLEIGDAEAASSRIAQVRQQLDVIGENQSRAPLVLVEAMLARHRGDKAEMARHIAQAKAIANAQSAGHWQSEIARVFPDFA